MVERSTRGTIILTYLKFVKKKWGKVGMDQCLSDIGLDPELKDGQYYSDEVLGNVIKWIYKNKGPEAVKQSGSFTTKDLGNILIWQGRGRVPGREQGSDQAL